MKIYVKVVFSYNVLFDVVVNGLFVASMVPNYVPFAKSTKLTQKWSRFHCNPLLSNCVDLDSVNSLCICICLLLMA